MRRPTRGALDAGRAHPGGAPDAIRFDGKDVPNFRKTWPQSILGREQSSSRGCAGRARPGRCGATRWARSTGARIRRTLLPAALEPVGVAFITGLVSAPGLAEAFEHRFPKDHPLRALYAGEVGGKPRPIMKLLLHHGVRVGIEYERTGDLAAARRASNSDLSPHLKSWTSGRAYAALKVTAEAAECSSSASRVPSNAARARTAGPCGTA